MTLEQLFELYIESDVIWEYNANEICNISPLCIRFSDGRNLVFEECRKHFPYGDRYIAARFSPYFWQFYTEKDSIVIVCLDNKDSFYDIADNIGFLNSFDLS